MGESAYHTLGKRHAVLLRALTSCIPAVAVRKLVTSSYHSNGNGGVDRVNHTMAQMLAVVINNRKND